MVKEGTQEYQEMQAEIRRNVRRIQQILRRMEKKGYVVDVNKPLLKEFTVSKTSLRKLEKQTLSTIQKKTYEVNVETGELEKVKFKKPKKKKKKPGVKKPTPTPAPSPIDVVRTVFSNILSYARQILGTSQPGLEMFRDIEKMLTENYKEHKERYVEFILKNSVDVNRAVEGVAFYNIYDDEKMVNSKYAEVAYSCYDDLRYELDDRFNMEH